MPELDALKTGQLIYVNQLDVADSWRQVPMGGIFVFFCFHLSGRQAS